MIKRSAARRSPTREPGPSPQHRTRRGHRASAAGPVHRVTFLGYELRPVEIRPGIHRMRWLPCYHWKLIQWPQNYHSQDLLHREKWQN